MKKTYQIPAIKAVRTVVNQNVLAGSTLGIDRTVGTQNDFETKEVGTFEFWDTSE